jgi:hypothetical protein
VASTSSLKRMEAQTFASPSTLMGTQVLRVNSSLLRLHDTEKLLKQQAKQIRNKGHLDPLPLQKLMSFHDEVSPT